MIRNLVESIFLALSTTLTSVVPILYKTLEKLASVQILSQGQLETIWNNLYVLLSVLILFAIAVKLVNGIVNPDALTDKKKGAKAAYIRAAIAVVLVVVLPLMYSMFHDVQTEILEENLIPKFIFGDDSSSDGGAKLTWIAISSCMDIGAMAGNGVIVDLEDLGLEEYGDGTGIYMPEDPTALSATAFMTIVSVARPGAYLASRLASLGGVSLNNFANMNDVIDGYFDFHPVILFIFLAVIAYELIIMVLDTALRAFKLALLELMTPVILGAYVFKADILKNWFIEYIKTFLQVFLLIIALCFIEFLVPIATNIAQLNTSGFSLLNGIIRLLIYAGALRLAKQIGPLINKIFGTNIQAKGGIKGRLGEMAVVGGLAQKAWGAVAAAPKKIGQGAFNLGKLGVQGVGKLGYDQLDNKYKSEHGAQTFRNNPTVRKVLGFGKAAKEAVKSGNGQKVVDTYTAGSKPKDLTSKQTNSILEQISATEGRYGFTKGSYDKFKKDANGQYILDPNGKKVFKNKADHERDKNEALDFGYENTSQEKGSAEVKDHLRKASKATSKANVVNDVKKNADSFIELLSEIEKNPNTDSETSKKISDIKKNFSSDRKNSNEELIFLQNSDGISAGNRKTLIELYSKHKKAYDEAINEYGLTGVDLSQAGLSSTKLQAEKAANDEVKLADNLSKDWAPDAKLYYERAKEAVLAIGNEAGPSASNNPQVAVPMPQGPAPAPQPAQPAPQPAQPQPEPVNYNAYPTGPSTTQNISDAFWNAQTGPSTPVQTPIQVDAPEIKVESPTVKVETPEPKITTSGAAGGTTEKVVEKIVEKETKETTNNTTETSENGSSRQTGDSEKPIDVNVKNFKDLDKSFSKISDSISGLGETITGASESVSSKIDNATGRIEKALKKEDDDK